MSPHLSPVPRERSPRLRTRTARVVVTTSLLAGLSGGLAAGPVAATGALDARAASGRHDQSPETAAVNRTAAGSHTVTWSAPGRHVVFASSNRVNPSKSGRRVGASAWGSVTVKRLDPRARWYFEVAPARAVRAAAREGRDVRGTVVSTRSVGLDGSTNTRDLGGMRTSDGRSVRWGVLFRSDAVTAPTERDMAVLRSMRLRHVVDFRAESEVAASGPNRLPAGVTAHAVPLLDASTDALSQAIQAALRERDPAIVEALLGDGKAEQIAADGPIDLIRSTPAREGFAATLRTLAASDGVPLIFNCTAGKDRTGVFAAVLQRLLGVSERTVLADYELSNSYRATGNAATYERLSAAGVDLALIRPLLEQSGANLAGMFRAIEEDYGTFDRFLLRGLGLERSTIAALKARLLV
ncbi:tyrosine-protein phosphatase [Nocardioides sp. zg-DK7169]|uniref:tyrosine-protein phosphatase n=1 Tax=Nocardioides sp. zg-DK7169 TaxID=2736600 RepID=UPI001552A0DD|nr:tyrosine-protein phosphatase [Nocardioides sp. zg-DK7169]NPC96853.1 tyrosine-protein phosphatase [Nocardioides sp. zg-DK7169]